VNISKRQQLFQSPTKEFQGKPFWSWNGKLEEKELLRQIDIIKEMGFGGYFMHSRTGLETEYLGKDWFELIDKCAAYGDAKGMESWLYDEDRWPSGSAGGLVTEEEMYRAMFIEMNRKTAAEFQELNWTSEVVAAFACTLEGGFFRTKRRLVEKDRLFENEEALLFTLTYAECNDNYNGYTYVDTMNKEAIERYIAITHEQYKEKNGEKFGKEITGIFTDEPHRGPCFTEFSGGKSNRVPYTPGLFDVFEKQFGYSLKERLPELFLREEGKELSKETRDYYELCQELFLQNYAIPIQKWCRENNLLLTGHVLHEDNLSSQVTMQGSLMRYYEHMDYPGIDLLGEYNNCYWVVKQVISVARQLNREWVLSELYGCTGWQMNFESYKNIGDWQALFGINLRCPHLSWYTMKGEAKRDYPASILHQSPWYQDYHYLEDYYSRIHVALHAGQPECELLVINPIESVWARAYSGAFQGLNSSDPEIDRLEKQYVEVFQCLTSHHIDFDYGEEDIMSRHGKVEDGILYVGSSAYKKVLVAGVDTLRKTTLDLLDNFHRQGGEVIFAGQVPGYVDVQPSKAVIELANRAIVIPWEEETVADACCSGKEIIVESEGSKSIFVQSKAIEGGRMIMLLNVNKDEAFSNVRIKLGKGKHLELWDARTGKISRPKYESNQGEIEVIIELEAGGERIFFLGEQDRNLPMEMNWRGTIKQPCGDSFHYTLTEKNICVLDYVKVTGEQGVLINKQEVLKADRALRDYFGIPYRGGEMLQPWYEAKFEGGDKKKLIELSLDYQVEIDTPPSGVELVVEDLDHIREIRVNGVEVQTISQGRWIDICFDRISIPDHIWKKGSNTITVIMDYYKTSGLEAVYLLGDFGIELTNGSKPVLTVLPEKLMIGDVTEQGLPFYSGSIIYHIEGYEKHRVYVEASKFGGSLVKLLGKENAILAFPPHSGSVDGLCGIQVVLTRRNTFGPFHQLPKKSYAYGPNNFITENEEWTDNYVLYEQGLLEKPILLI
jgi:hypothetical protein